eukprot:357381-Chlamydomonas_euryale.AAC.10
MNSHLVEGSFPTSLAGVEGRCMASCLPDAAKPPAPALPQAPRTTHQHRCGGRCEFACDHWLPAPTKPQTAVHCSQCRRGHTASQAPSSRSHAASARPSAVSEHTPDMGHTPDV